MKYTDEQFARYVREEINENQLLGRKIEGEFRIGDRVVCNDVGSYPLDNQHGVIVDKTTRHAEWLVQFDNDIKGHSGNGISRVKGKEGHCWFVLSEDMKHE